MIEQLQFKYLVSIQDNGIDKGKGYDKESVNPNYIVQIQFKIYFGKYWLVLWDKDKA